jgi:hypothetical protein
MRELFSQNQITDSDILIFLSLSCVTDVFFNSLNLNLIEFL